MNVPIRMLGIATTVFWIFLIAFVALVVFSVKNLNFDMGEPEFETSPDGKLMFSLPLYINNRGYYSLKEFQLSTMFLESEGLEITRAGTFVPVISHGEKITILHNVTLSLDSLFEKGEKYMFNDTNLSVAIMAGLNFAEIFPAQISTNFTFPWGAPFYNFALGEPAFGRFNYTHNKASVPVSFENHASFNLVGNIRIEIYNSEDLLLSENQTTFNVPQYSSYNGDMNFYVPLTSVFLSAARSGHFKVYFSTSFVEYGPLVVPYG